MVGSETFAATFSGTVIALISHEARVYLGTVANDHGSDSLLKLTAAVACGPSSQL